MPDRVANTIVLVEDVTQQSLVRRFLQHLRGTVYSDRRIRFAPLPQGRECGEAYVRGRYPEQVRACRNSRGRKCSAVLIVLLDADTVSVDVRERQLAVELDKTGTAGVRSEEPIMCLIPRRNVETWLLELSGELCDEDTDYKPKTRDCAKSYVKEAAKTLFDWTRPNAEPPATITGSLRTALPRWRRIPK